MIFWCYICTLFEIYKICKMDIVSRLKDFREHLNMSVTQFADVCNIPRPTMSQLLSGRNKKVSDELLRKFHQQFPQLNLMWLLFGEGDMLQSGNFETSGPKDTSFSAQDTTDQSDPQEIKEPIDFNIPFDESESENLETETPPFPGIESHRIFPVKESVDPEKPQPTTISFNSDSERKIVNIIVYYNDNSFESFVPGLPGSRHT